MTQGSLTIESDPRSESPKPLAEYAQGESRAFPSPRLALECKVFLNAASVAVS